MLQKKSSDRFPLRFGDRPWIRWGVKIALVMTAVLLVSLLYRDVPMSPQEPEASGASRTLHDQRPNLANVANEALAGSHRTTSSQREKSAWAITSVTAVNPELIPDYKEPVADSVLVALANDMGDWKAGDRISFTVPQTGATYLPVIEEAYTLLGRNRSYVGRLFDDDSPYSFVFTVGERSAFANIGTPQGSFELVGNSTLAWLMPTANMDQHIDYSRPDYVVSHSQSDAR